MGSTYTFYSFPAPGSDPFGYTSKSARKKYGEGHYDANKSYSGGSAGGDSLFSRIFNLLFGGGDTIDDGGSFTSTKGSNVAEKVWNFFRGKGFSKAATAGIMGNAYAESSMNPTLLQSGRGPAAGLFQWENYFTKSGRFGNLMKFAKDRGKTWKDLDSQLNYAMKEFSNGATYWDKGATAYKNAGTTYPGSLDKFKQSKSVNTATRQFEAAFERAGIIRMDTRIKKAKEYYDKYKAYETGGIISEPTLSLMGEGGYAEYVISTDPKYSTRSQALLAQAASDLAKSSQVTATSGGVSLPNVSLDTDRVVSSIEAVGRIVQQGFASLNRNKNEEKKVQEQQQASSKLITDYA